MGELRVMLVSEKYLIHQNSPVVLPSLVHFVSSHSRVRTLSMWMPCPILLLGLPTMHLLLKPQRWSSKLLREDDTNGLPEPNVGRGRRHDVIILFGYGWSHGSGHAVLLFADGLSDSAGIVLVFELVDLVLMSDDMPHFLMLFALLAIIPLPSIIQFLFFIVKYYRGDR